MIACGGRDLTWARCFLTACQQFVGELQVFKIHKEMPRNLTKMITIAEVRPNGTRAVVDDGSVCSIVNGGAGF